MLKTRLFNVRAQTGSLLTARSIGLQPGDLFIMGEEDVHGVVTATASSAEGGMF